MSLRQSWHYDEHTKKVAQVTRGDVTHIAEDNLLHRNSGANGFSKDRSFRKIGSIPMHMMQEAYKEGINPLDGSPEAAAWIKKTLANNVAYRTVDTMKTNKKHIVK